MALKRRHTYAIHALLPVLNAVREALDEIMQDANQPEVHRAISLIGMCEDELSALTADADKG